MTAGSDNEDDEEWIGSGRDDGVWEMNDGKVTDLIVGDGDE